MYRSVGRRSHRTDLTGQSNKEYMSLQNHNLQKSIKEKIYDYKVAEKTITSYFPLNEGEKQEIRKIIDNAEFKTIFKDSISDKEWDKTKEQIIRKFKDELFRID